MPCEFSYSILSPRFSTSFLRSMHPAAFSYGNGRMWPWLLSPDVKPMRLQPWDLEAFASKIKEVPCRLSPQRKTNVAMKKSPFLIEDMYIFKFVGFPLSCMSCYINFCKGLDGDETSDGEHDDNTSLNQSVS